jgi:hypothetical protein
MLAVEGAGDRFDQNGERGNAPEMARLPQRENPLHPAIPLVVVGALHHLPPEDGKPEGSLCPVVRGFYPLLHDKRPQRAHLSIQRAGQRSCLILPPLRLVQQVHHPHIPGLDLPGGRRGLGPVHQPLQLRHDPPAGHGPSVGTRHTRR